MSKSQIRKSNRIPKSELEELLNDGKESKYWSAKPKPRRYIIENEKAEEYYDNLVLDALQKYDNICGQKFGNKVCFQKHCSHKQEEEKDQKKEDRQEEGYQEDDYQKEDYQGENYHQQEDNYQSNPLELLIETIKVVENKKEDEKQQIIKLVDYENTDEEIIESSNTIESESEEELTVGQVPLYLPPANFFQKI